jgi:O-antigen ligase
VRFLATTTAGMQRLGQQHRIKPGGVGFFWLSAFYLVYCARPEDWVHAIGVVPLAKITGVGAFLAFLFTAGRGKRKFRDLPVESYYLLVMIGVLSVSSLLSPVWKGGAISRTADFAKVYVVWVLTFLLVDNLPKFRRIVFIQAASVPVISLLSIVKGQGHERLDGVLGGIYSNPNDLAFAIVLSLPFCLMFLLTTRSMFRKLLWALGMLIMMKALFMTASRGGFITLVVAGTVCLWHFGVKGKRLYLIAITGITAIGLFAAEGKTLQERFASMWSDTSELDTRQERQAYGSYEQREFLMEKALECIAYYPIFGIGTRNFETYSGVWREVHMTYLQIAAEGGIVSLILYLLFFAKGFGNLRRLRRRKDLDPDVILFSGALHSSLVGFVVGALFSPEAYQFFPFFAVAYSSALFAYVGESDEAKLAAQPVRQAVSRPYTRVDRVPVNT